MGSAELQDDRDLRFRAAERDGAKTLASAAIDAYNERGYFHPLSLLSGREVERTRAYIDHLFELLEAEGEADNYALLGYHTRCAGLYDLAVNARILDVVEDIIGPDIVCWTSQVFCKIPHDPKSVPFHQDASYWPLTPARTVSAWLAIDDSDQENACVQVIPGTHKKGLLEWSKVEGDVVLDQEINGFESYGRPARIELRAGEFSIHADLLAHGSDPNKSDRRRCGYVLRYCPPSVKPLNPDWGRNAILCRGRDTTGYWTYVTRPHGDDVASWRSYWLRKAREGALRGRPEAQQGGNIGA